MMVNVRDVRMNTKMNNNQISTILIVGTIIFGMTSYFWVIPLIWTFEDKDVIKVAWIFNAIVILPTIALMVLSNSVTHNKKTMNWLESKGVKITTRSKLEDYTA